MHILIGGAWPYANGPLHIGHLAALLPGDLLARYHRLKGDRVLYVSGTDCHGTPVALKAQQEGVSPAAIADRYHREYVSCFERLGFSYDSYGKTSDEEHIRFVMNFHRQLYDSPSVYERESLQSHCAACGRFLPDRYVNGECPRCGQPARGDQCEACNEVFEAVELKNPVCALCGGPVALRPSTHLYLRLGNFADAIRRLIPAADNLRGPWRQYAIDLTERYLSEGLKDRALTRDLDWGVPVPREGYEGKVIYIWAENVLGYLSGSWRACGGDRADFDAFWRGQSARHYYVHGKDNVPFHSVILPGLLLGHGGGFHLPDSLAASAHMTLDGQKISTSRGHAVWLPDLLDRAPADAIRYFFLLHGPETRDADFTWREFQLARKELAGVYGNFVNRSLAFVAKYLDNAVPAGPMDGEIDGKIKEAYRVTGRLIEGLNFREALQTCLNLAKAGNLYFDRLRPWVTRTEDPAACAACLHTCVQLAANLAQLFEPFLPFSSAKVLGWLGRKSFWGMKKVPAGWRLPGLEILFPVE